MLTVAQSEFGFGGGVGWGELLIVGEVVDDYLKALVKQISLFNRNEIITTFPILESEAMLGKIHLNRVFCIRVTNVKCTNEITVTKL